MYLIHLTGVRNPVEVSTVKGDAIKKSLENNPDGNGLIEVSRRMFRMSAIKAIEYSSDNRSDREPTPRSLPLTKEEVEKRRAILARVRKELESKGVFKTKDGKQNTAIVWHKECVVCGKPNPKGMARVCSGPCYRKAPLPKEA